MPVGCQMPKREKNQDILSLLGQTPKRPRVIPDKSFFKISKFAVDGPDPALHGSPSFPLLFDPV